MNRVALLVDHPQRDLAGLVLLAVRLCTKGVTSFLVPARLARAELSGLAPDVVVLNHLRHVDVPLVRLLSEMGSRIAVLDTEGGVIECFDTYQQALADDETRKAVSRYFCWGSRLANHSLKKGWLTADQLVVTGNPRFDLYRDPWRQAVGSWRAEAAVDPRPMVLVVGSFSLANPRFLTVEQEVALLVSKAGQDPEVVRRRLQVEQEALRCVVELANNLADALPTARIVFRPHPFESSETYVGLLSSQVELGDRGPAIEWILQADAVVQRGSTLAVEGAMAGVPVLSPEWLPDWTRAEWIRNLSVGCSNLDKLVAGIVAAIEHRRDTHAIPPDVEALLTDWFFRADGAANERVAEGLCEALSDGRHVSRMRARTFFAGARGPGRSLRQKAVGWIRSALLVPADFSISSLRRIDGPWQWDDGSRTFSVDQVRALAESFVSSGFDPALAVGVTACREREDYVLPYRMGRSIAVFPGAGGIA